MRKMKKKPTRIVSEAKEVLSKDAKKIISDHQAEVIKPSGGYAKAKYSRKDPKHRLVFTTGYDMLQYTIAVDEFIYKKYSIGSPLELKVLLYLFPIQYFAMRDIKALPIRQYNMHLKTLMEMNYIEVAIQAKAGVASNLYGLTDHAKKIVKDYYGYLSGEKTLPATSHLNPFKDPEATRMDHLREKLMAKLKRQTETQGNKFRKFFY